MTDVLFDGMPFRTHDLSPEGTGIVGNRHLMAVQTFDIARLTAHPVPFVPGTFIAVTGQGPKGDSNGSGKTSFESAVSLLLAEAQWRLEANGSAAAAGLLFKPESAGLDPQHRYAPAERGYIIGVFADPDRAQPTVLTVWVRVGVASPYVKARWTHGLHVPTGDTEPERYEQADRLWDALPRANEIGPKTMARELYGDAPRCMAYLDTPLRKSGPSLLSQQMTEMDPDRIGEALIDLTGRAGLLENEQQHRSGLAEQKAALADKEVEDLRARVDEQADLDGVHHRDTARGYLAEGERMWRLHFARGYLDVTDTVAAMTVDIDNLVSRVSETEAHRDAARERVQALLATTDLADQVEQARLAHQTLSQQLTAASGDRRILGDRLGEIASRRAVLLPLRDAWTGLSAAEAQTAVNAAISEQIETAAALQVAQQQHDEAARDLEAVRGGGGGPSGDTLRLLAAAGITAIPLLDAITLDEDARAVWEPRLWPYRYAVVIAPADEPSAVEALRVSPGAVVLVADAPLDAPVTEMPDGVHATAPVARLLTTLATRSEHRVDPHRAHDRDAGQFVIGDFRAPIAGHAARVAAAVAGVTHLVASLTRAQETDRLARLRVEAATEARTAAEAVEELHQLRLEESEKSEQAAALDATIAELRDKEEIAQRRWVEARANHLGHEQQIQIARDELLRREDALDAARSHLATKRTERDQQNLLYWETGWNDTRDAAKVLLLAQEEQIQRLTARRLRSRAADALNDALNSYLGAATEIPDDLREARNRREALRDGFGGVSGDSVDFTTLARPLRDLLDARADSDRVLEDRITRAQWERADQIEAMRTETGRLETDLHGLQDAISARIEASLRKIGAALDRLNRGRGGFGAELKISETRPATPTMPWKWEVTPRWRRSASGGLVSYREVANGAQVKQIAIQLVLAALLAAEGATGRVLILDELGNSLGDVNRKDVLSDLHVVAAEQNVTILGTCQDSVLADAAGVCGEILWFRHATHSDPYNLPTRLWGFDGNGQRVELTRDWLTAGRQLV